jgi:glycosyltransferase involved in cell wall biosynthesis
MAISAEQPESNPAVLLSLVVPFYNSELKSGRLLSTLGELSEQDVEIVCVDDGSSDGTLKRIKEFQENALVPVRVLSQENRGPGGARNTGLRGARGEYVWFVDSDDDIGLEAIDILRDVSDDGFDFIDFNFNLGARNAMMLPAGPHVIIPGERAPLIANFGSLCTKIFSRAFLDSAAHPYPEYCYYEDNGLGFVLAMNTRRFLKSELELYEVHLDFESITRGKSGPRFFDRLHTAASGAREALPLAVSESERKAIAERFRGLFMSNTCRQLFRSLRPEVGIVASLKVGDWANFARQSLLRFNPLPVARTAVLSARVMRHYRGVAESLGLSSGLALEAGYFRLRAFLWFSAIVSGFLPSQGGYFAGVRASAWPASDVSDPRIVRNTEANEMKQTHGGSDVA